MIVIHQINCETCEKLFTKKRSDKLAAPRFCSNACKFKSHEVERPKFNCLHCGKEFQRYVSPGDKAQERMYCGRSCQMKALKGPSDAGIKDFVCKRCGKPFRRYVKTGKTATYCSRSCSAKDVVEGGLNACSSFERMMAVGNDQLMKKMSEIKSQAAIDRNTGRSQTEDTKEKISASCTGISNVLNGKTYEEFYGAERAKELAHQHSEKLKEGYACGRIKPNVHSSCAPTFRGVRLRSLLEQAAVLFLEERDGLELGKTLLYEHPSTFAHWTDDEGVGHTYIPDLYDTVNEIVYEVKPAWMVANPTREMQLKGSAVASSGRTFRYLTDHDIV